MRNAKCIFFLFLLSGCSRSEGKTIFDYIQFLLSQDTWFRWIACILLVYLFLQILRIFRLAFQFLFRFIKKTYRFTFIWGKRNLIIIAVLGTLLWAFSLPLIDLLQDIEQRFFYPVYVDEFSNFSEEHLTVIFEAELSNTMDPYHKSVVLRRTREIAAKIQSTPLAIYEAAYLECGLKPFEVRTDQVAAGWIQFTRAGLQSLVYKGKPVRFEAVLSACKNKDINFMMDLTEVYLVRKYERSGRVPLNNTIDLYLAIFAPAFIGAPSDKVVYEGFNNPSYFKNAGLDGWYVAEDSPGRKQIFSKTSERDGKITIYEIFLAIESKKNRLVHRYLN
ncbi:MAG: hypothetical protein H6574_15970 [Lewinellaceae bacterium]|nr:hypothetical protein [Saprospiraceae bacterium]MCB9332579.1 hypothetical protein [Lewinellaceae bacterium]